MMSLLIVGILIAMKMMMTITMIKYKIRRLNEFYKTTMNLKDFLDTKQQHQVRLISLLPITLLQTYQLIRYFEHRVDRLQNEHALIQEQLQNSRKVRFISRKLILEIWFLLQMRMMIRMKKKNKKKKKSLLQALNVHRLLVKNRRLKRTRRRLSKIKDMINKI